MVKDPKSADKDDKVMKMDKNQASNMLKIKDLEKQMILFTEVFMTQRKREADILSQSEQQEPGVKEQIKSTMMQGFERFGL